MRKEESTAVYSADSSGLPQITRIIDTTSGPVRGLINDGVQTFKGIRYGAPPVGPLRWMPPQRPTPSKVVLDCSDYGAPAMQMASGATAAPAGDYGMLMARVFTTPSELKIQNEDCLFLNVWTPATDNQKRPVMFWIHGGIFAYGSGGQPVYCMEDLARDHDVVAVNVNHRLNVFGYLHLGDLMGDAYKSSGTVGMQDLVLALQWVRDNIANFGGDPGNVTIMGQSGGGAKVSILMSMDSAKGLFHKASIQSGPGLMVGRREPATAAAKALLRNSASSPAISSRSRECPPRRSSPPPSRRMRRTTPGRAYPACAGLVVLATSRSSTASRSRAIHSRPMRLRCPAMFRCWSAT